MLKAGNYSSPSDYSRIIALLYHTGIDSLDYKTLEYVCMEALNMENFTVELFILNCNFVFEESTNFVIFDKEIVNELYFKHFKTHK